VDSGLAAHLLGISQSRLSARDPSAPSEFGHVTETFAVNELIKQAGWAEAQAQRYIYRMTVTMYNEHVKTITITIPEDLDERAAAEARRRGISKSELIRQGLGCVLVPAPQGSEEDPWRSLAGFGADGISVRPGEVDDVIYGR